MAADPVTGLSGSRALVTGARGFIGLHLIKLLARVGAVVSASVRRPVSGIEGAQNVHPLDLTDLAAVRKLVGDVRPDYVFHLAGVSSAARTLDAVLPTFHSNITATVNLLTAISESPGCRRIVLAGSLEEPIEPGIQTPSSPYAASKLACTQYAKMFHSLFGTPATVARIFMVYGPAQPDIRKLVPYVTISLLKHESPSLSSGTRPVDWVYVEDVVDALARAAVAPGLEGKSIDIGSGVLTPVRSVVQQLASLVGNGSAPTFGSVPDRPLEQVQVADIATTRQLLGSAPATPLSEGLRRTVEWYREQLATQPA